MTETYWHACTDPAPMLAFLRGRASGRTLRLFACACARRVWDRLDAPGRWAVRAAERSAEGAGADGELGAAHAEAHAAALGTVLGWGANRRLNHAGFAAASCAAPDPVGAAAMAAQDLLRLADEEARRPAEEAAQVADIRCVFGDPFRPVAVDPNWLTSTVLALARRADEAHEYGALPILADALQDAGCDSADVLDHCRGPGPHGRGCWVVDLLLAKEGT